ncbi:glycosyltransferase family 2 protein [Persicitalea jodogahamensis]|uniref:Glycosyl transferase n=1 Tax=Persicitalea jodogahamensis TaxID=402147 RepID=A0A8J3D1T6_9BACT|nr:glycosyltransferase family 2 protein [Persicitalea jodogahamensis]GHB56790.1 glycosyl transferase [Persicitalea jodogahamensis]
MPLLTIITITYNAEQFLERTLRSVAKAARLVPGVVDEVEYILVDGASQDGTLQIAEQYSSLFTRILSEPDKGLYDAMNKGLSLATGDYLWFLNAGDEVHDGQVLSRLLHAFQDPADVYYSDALFVDDSGQEIGLRSQVTPHALPKEIHWQDFALGMKISHQAFIVRRTIVPAYDTTNLSADIDWEIKCLKRSQKTVYLPFVLCRYLTGGISARHRRRSLLDRFKVLRGHFGLFPTVVNHIRIVARGLRFYSFKK